MPVPKNPLILKFSEIDTPFSVSRQTFDRLVAHFGLSPEEVVHLALRRMAVKELPKNLTQYEADDGPLSEEAIKSIRKMTGPVKKARVRSSLF